MNSKSFSESFSKTFSKGVRTAMHLKWPSYLLLLEKQCIFNPKTGHESPDSDPRLQFQFTSLFSPPSEHCANLDSQFTTLLSQARKPSLDPQPFTLRPVHNIV